MSDPYVTIFFDWQQASADPRKYGQQRTLLSTHTRVAVDVPLKHEYIWNAEPIIQAQLSGGTTIEPVLTPMGVVYVDNIFAAAYGVMEVEEEFSDGDADVDWEDDEKVVLEGLEDDDEFPVEEMFDEEDEDLDEILWEN